jgi:hypothetical protein
VAVVVAGFRGVGAERMLANTSGLAGKSPGTRAATRGAARADLSPSGSGTRCERYRAGCSAYGLFSIAGKMMQWNTMLSSMKCTTSSTLSFSEFPGIGRLTHCFVKCSR